MECPKTLRPETDGSSEYFPIEIISEILSRLPVKAVGRFTTVSKSWYSLITSPSFINTHMQNYSRSVSNDGRRPSIMLIPTIIKELENHSYSLLSDNSFVKQGNFDIPMVYHWLEIMYIGNSCNGIICLADQKSYFGREVFLYNPSIKKIKIVSYDCFADVLYERRRVFSKLGFGFCESTNDYKVVRIHYIKDENSRKLGNLAPEVEVYSSNTDRWTRIVANVKCLVNYKSVSCNGYIYWLSRSGNDGVFDTVMCFDLAREVFCEIGLPDKCKCNIDGSLLVYKGSLALFKVAFGIGEDGRVRSYELWVMEEYNMAKSWTILSVLETSRSVFKALGATTSGKILIEIHRNMLASWDPEKNLLKHLDVDAFLTHVDTAFVESLALYEGGNIASASTTTKVGDSSQGTAILQYQQFLLEAEFYKVRIHGECVMVRVASDLTLMNKGVNELRSLCLIRPALVGIMVKAHDMPSNIQLCVKNYCLIVQLDCLDQVPEALRDFLASSEICFMRVGPDRLDFRSENLEKKDLQFSDLVYRVQKKQYLGRNGLKLLGDEVGVHLEGFPAGYDLDWRGKKLSEENLKWIIYHVYSSFKIGCKLRCSL